MVTEYKYGQMGQSIKGNGLITEHVAKVFFGMQMEIFLKGNSKMTNQMDTEFTLAQMEPDMRACG